MQIKNSLCLYLIYFKLYSFEVGLSNKVDGTEGTVDMVNTYGGIEYRLLLLWRTHMFVFRL